MCYHFFLAWPIFWLIPREFQFLQICFVWWMNGSLVLQGLDLVSDRNTAWKLQCPAVKCFWHTKESELHLVLPMEVGFLIQLPKGQLVLFQLDLKDIANWALSAYQKIRKWIQRWGYTNLNCAGHVYFSIMPYFKCLMILQWLFWHSRHLRTF